MGDNKTWNRPWEIEEIVDNAHQWSLAGDAGLLKYLEKFSDNIFFKAEQTNDNLNDLMNNVEEVNLKLDIAKNKFLSLQNKQFVESRVYEDDESDQKSNEFEKDVINEVKGEIKTDTLKAAVLNGISILNQYYDKVDVLDSDSEDNDESPNFVLRPKDPYIERPLPYVIGSEEWHKKWHVGLEDTSSEGESDKLSDNVTDSDSENELLHTNCQLNKDVPEAYGDEFSRSINQPVANSTLNDNDTEDVFESSDSDDNHSYPSQAVVTNGNFAQQLSKKLGNIIQNETMDDIVNTRPIMKPDNTNKYSTNLFADEPPPLDDEVDPKSKPGLFSGGQGLFDDSESDNDSWPTNGVQHKAEEKALDKSIGNKAPIQGTTKGLFESDSDDDLFSTNRTRSETHKSFLSPPQNDGVLFPSDVPPVLEEDTVKRKPVGGISPFGNVNLFGEQDLSNILQNRNKEKNTLPIKEEPLPSKDTPLPSKEEPLFEEALSEKLPEKKVFTNPVRKVKDEVKPEKSITLFDEEGDDLFKDDFLGSVSTKKLTSNLFDSDSDDDFAAKKTKQIKPEKSKIKGLFDQDSDNKLLFVDDDDKDKSKDGDLFNINTKKSEQEVITIESHSTPPPDVDISTDKSNQPNPVFHVDLFSSTPPPLDDDWDVNVDNIEENVPYEYPTFNTRSNLFDNEPPSLTLNETSGIVKDLSERTDNSFLPHASSTRRFSSENQEQYSTAYLVTKSSLNSLILDTIPEPIDRIFDTNSKVNVTPSGISSELYNSKESNQSVPVLEDDLFKRNTTTNNENSSERKLLEKDVFDERDESIVSVKDMWKGLKQEASPENVKKDSPRKLSHNLNINVNALLPGAYGSFKSGNSSKEGADKNDSSQYVVSEDAEEKVQTLPCVTKDRAKVVKKRRPSTRRGRQELLRKADADFKITNEPNESNLDSIILNPSQEEIPSKVEDESYLTEEQSKELSEEKSEQFIQPKRRPLIFKTDDGPEPFQNVITNILPSFDDFLDDNNLKKASLFDDVDEMCSSTSNEIASKPLSNSLFDEDDGDDLFSSKYFSNVKSKEKDLSKNVPKVEDAKNIKDTSKDHSLDININRRANLKHDNTSNTNKSLFDDDANEDEDSLFSNNNENFKKKSTIFVGQHDEDVFNKNPLKKKSKSLKKSLFDDDDESDDDIFGKNNTTLKTEIKRVPKPRMENRKVNIKSKTLEPIDDPLNVFKQ